MRRARVFLTLLAGLRVHDLRAAGTWIRTMYGEKYLPTRLFLFIGWALRTMVKEIPDALQRTRFADPVSKTPIWLGGPDPFENYPFSHQPEAKLPDAVDVAVIGAGFVGAGAAYHWSKMGNTKLIVLEQNGVASGSAGRNQGLVVMGRHFYMVYETVNSYLKRKHPEMSAEQRDEVAREFATAYARAAYANAEMIAETIEKEGIDCDYVAKGWVYATDPAHLHYLNASTRMAQETGFDDWLRISKEEAFERGGLQTSCEAAFSRGAATWHPVKWVRGLFKIALQSPWVELFTATKVTRVEDLGERYAVHTNRGTVTARYLINAMESYTPQLFPEFHELVRPVQTQAAFGFSDGGTMKEGVGLSAPQGFFGRHKQGVLFGSDATPVGDKEAGSNQPSRFITKYVLTLLRDYAGVRHIRVTSEWSGTVGYTPDEFPLVGLMDGKRLYMVGGMAGSGSAVSFNGARHVVCKILGIDGPDYYPEKYFSPCRFQRV